jgi:uncharacterized protein YbjQ (UPF0145 family)
MFAVTIENLPGYRIKEVVGEVLGTTARRQNVFTEGIRQLPGDGRGQIPQALRKWRKDAIARMVEDAYRQGANAVVGVRFDHRSIGEDWTELCAYGTAVFVVPDRP